jgi:hypothetical protein
MSPRKKLMDQARKARSKIPRSPPLPKPKPGRKPKRITAKSRKRKRGY